MPCVGPGDAGVRNVEGLEGEKRWALLGRARSGASDSRMGTMESEAMDLRLRRLDAPAENGTGSVGCEASGGRGCSWFVGFDDDGLA